MISDKLYEYILGVLEEEQEHVESQPFCGASVWAAEAFEGIVAEETSEIKWAIEELKKLKKLSSREGFVNAVDELEKCAGKVSSQMTIAGIPSDEYEEQMINDIPS